MLTHSEIFPGIHLRCVQDRRFKHSALSLQYIRPMCREEAAMNALIPSVLLRGCKSAPDLRQITQRLDDLYGAAVSPISRRAGDWQTTGLYLSLMDDRFAREGEALTEQAMDFLKELLFAYPEENDGFLPEFVEGEKINQIYAIEAEFNDKRAYCAQQLLKNMCREDSFGVPRMGEREDVEAVTPQALLSHYRRLRRESQIEILYVGSAAPERMAGLVRKLFAEEDRAPLPLPAQTGLRLSKAADLRERMELTQGKLCMGFVTPVTAKDPGFPAMQLLCAVFGGDVTSKLFRNIREKQSLCYSIGAGYYSAKGIVLVSAGIDFDKEAHVREEVLRQLDACRRGEITEEELTAARASLISALESVPDSPGALESYYSSMVLGGSGLDPQAHRKALEAVTPEDLTRAADSLTPHSTCFLKGVSQ